MPRVSAAKSVELCRLSFGALRGGTAALARSLPVLLTVVSSMLFTSCASNPPVGERDRFPLDPREDLAGPFPDGVSRGWSRLLAGDAGGAEAAFRGAAGDARDSAAQIGRIESLVLLGRQREAWDLCGPLLGEGEPTRPLLVACGEARARDGDAVAGYALYRKALARTDNRPVLAERAEQLRGAASDGLSAKARESVSRQQWEDARTEIGQAIEVAPERTDLLVEAGDIEAAAGKPEQALRLYREALQRDPENATLKEKTGSLALESGSLDLAVAMFDDLAKSDPRFTSRAEEARLAFRVANWPRAEREAARSARLTRAGAATLVWWMYPEVRDARVAGGVVASDVVSRRDSRALTRALALGLLEADRETHRANPDSALTLPAAARLLLRLLGFVVPESVSLPCPRAGQRVLRSAAESIQAAQACGLLPETENAAVTGVVFTEALDRIRLLSGPPKP
jgi:tetratricopeptide (TPR) repeat protein